MKLLEILLAEEGEVGAGLQEQLGDDGGDAVEMAGPERAAKTLASPPRTETIVAKPSG